jgi:hypothetical protein
LGVIYERFGLGDLSGDELRAVSEIDDSMLYYEFEALADVKIKDLAPYITLSHDFAYKPMADVERDFLNLFDSLYHKQEE